MQGLKIAQLGSRIKVEFQVKRNYEGFELKVRVELRQKSIGVFLNLLGSQEFNVPYKAEKKYMP